MNPISETGEYNFSAPHSIFEIEEFVKEVLACTDPGFAAEINEHGITKFNEMPLGKYLQNLDFYLNQFGVCHVSGVYAKLFYHTCKQLRIEGCSLEKDPNFFYPNFGKYVAELFNDLLDGMRSNSRTIEFKKKLYDVQYSSLRNYRSCVGYIEALFARYSRLLVLRLDFSYHEAHRATILEAQEDIEHYLNNSRSNRLFDSRVGYIISLEFTKKKGLHMHCFFFLNGAEAFQDVFLAQKYGNYWVRLTEGRGMFFNCNMKKEDYKLCGIGMVHYADIQMRQNLLLPIQYITKPSQRVMVKTSLKSRTFWRGEVPKEKSIGIGRPRTKMV